MHWSFKTIQNGQGHLETVQSAQNASALCLLQSILKLMAVAARMHFSYCALAVDAAEMRVPALRRTLCRVQLSMRVYPS